MRGCIGLEDNEMLLLKQLLDKALLNMEERA